MHLALNGAELGGPQAMRRPEYTRATAGVNSPTLATALVVEGPPLVTRARTPAPPP